MRATLHKNVRGPFTAGVPRVSDVPRDVRLCTIRVGEFQCVVTVAEINPFNPLPTGPRGKYIVNYHGTETLIFNFVQIGDVWDLDTWYAVVTHTGRMMRRISLHSVQPKANVEDLFEALTMDLIGRRELM